MKRATNSIDLKFVFRQLIGLLQDSLFYSSIRMPYVEFHLADEFFRQMERISTKQRQLESDLGDDGVQDQQDLDVEDDSVGGEIGAPVINTTADLILGSRANFELHPLINAEDSSRQVFDEDFGNGDSKQVLNDAEVNRDRRDLHADRSLNRLKKLPRSNRGSSQEADSILGSPAISFELHPLIVFLDIHGDSRSSEVIHRSPAMDSKLHPPNIFSDRSRFSERERQILDIDDDPHHLEIKLEPDLIKDGYGGDLNDDLDVGSDNGDSGDVIVSIPDDGVLSQYIADMLIDDWRVLGDGALDSIIGSSELGALKMFDQTPLVLDGKVVEQSSFDPFIKRIWTSSKINARVSTLKFLLDGKPPSQLSLVTDRFEKILYLLVFIDENIKDSVDWDGFVTSTSVSNYKEFVYVLVPFYSGQCSVGLDD